MVCPHCQGKLHYCVDAIVTYTIKENGVLDHEETHKIDNDWIECRDCMKTSDDDLQLSKLIKDLVF